MKIFFKQRKIFFFFMIFIAIFLFSLNVSFAETSSVKAPENFQETEQVGKKALDVTQKDLPGIISGIWKNEVWPVWRKWGIFFEGIWDKFKKIFQNETKKRESVIKAEFEKEKQEMKEGIKTELPSIGKSLWQKMKEIFK